MSSDENLCDSNRHILSREVEHMYFPNNKQEKRYDVLPLFAVDEYYRRMMKSFSILENPFFAKKWEEYRAQLPEIARTQAPVTFTSAEPTVAFVNYRKQKVPVDFATRFIGKPRPEAIFHKAK